ncbi:MAG: response regulator [Acidobacteriales bacterium]|nr:response regulator [Terriglobales bacterium]
MSRILLADDSPHAQRMGERILREEGFEVVTVTDGETAMVRLADVDPNLILADVYLPGKSGYDICRAVKSDPRYRFTRVVLTAGALEPIDEEEARRAQADGILKKPFEASAVIETIRTLLEAAEFAREMYGEKPAEIAATPPPAPEAAPEPLPPPPPAPDPEPPAAPPPTPEVDSERVRAAVTLALEAALPAMIDEITDRVLIALGH